MNIIFGNFGDNTIALIQWAYENKLEDVYVLHVNTSWSAEGWGERVSHGVALIERYKFESIELKSPSSFSEMVKDRQQFPSQKFQWCAGFLKGLAFLSWAHEHDPQGEATVILGSRRADSRIRHALDEFKDQSEHFGDRRVWYPLYKHSDDDRNALIHRAGFEVLNHRSPECEPCIHSHARDFKRMSQSDIQKINTLEIEINKPMFPAIDYGGAQSIEQVINWVNQKNTDTDHNNLEPFDMGCGALYSCGE